MREAAPEQLEQRQNRDALWKNAEDLFQQEGNGVLTSGGGLWVILLPALLLFPALHSVRFGACCPFLGSPLRTGSCGARGRWTLRAWSRVAAAGTLALASAAGGGGGGCAWWFLHTVLFGSREGLLVVLSGSFWPIVLLFRSAVGPMRAARRNRLHLGDSQHGLCGRGRWLVQETQVLIGCLLLLAYGRQIRLGEDVLGDGALGAAGGRAAAVVGPGLFKALLGVLLLRGVSLGWQWL